MTEDKTMTMTNAEWLIKNGYSFYGLDCDDLEGEGVYYIFVGGTYIDKIKTDDSPLGAMLKWLDAEHKETILDDEEWQYLAAVIKPFRDRVRHIKKVRFISDESEYQYIVISLRDVSYNIALPIFKKGTMYKGMETGRAYFLKELGL